MNLLTPRTTATGHKAVCRMCHTDYATSKVGRKRVRLLGKVRLGGNLMVGGVELLSNAATFTCIAENLPPITTQHS